MSSSIIKVLLADDHQLMVEGFRIALSSYGIDVVEVAYTLDKLAEIFLATNPDVLVIDLRFNSDSQHVNLDGLDLCQEILAKEASAKIVVYSQFDDQYIVEKTYKIGALAFVRKDESVDVLVNAIKSAQKGEVFLSPVIAKQLALGVLKDKNPTKLLDGKELTVFKLVADGMSLVDIAASMSFSTKSINTFIKNIKNKLSIDNTADFTKLAIKSGLTNLDIKSHLKQDRQE